MGSYFAGKVMMSMYEQPAKVVANGELEPIRAGAWAAWARSYAAEHAAAQAADAAQTGDRVAHHRARRLAIGSHRG